MLNEDRVILMTQMASFENGEGKKSIKIGNYFRSDYIALQILKAVICGTIAFAVVFALYIFYNFEVIMQELYEMDLAAFAKTALFRYLLTVGSYTVLTYIVCTYRYARAQKNLRNYYRNLKQLNALYNEQQQ